MENKFGRKSVFHNIAWKLFERASSLFVTFVVTIILARLLEPADFGLAAMITIFVTVSTIFVTGGLSNALIQKKEADELDFSSIFWLNLLISIIIYSLLFVFAPNIASFYRYPQLVSMLRVLGLNLVIAAINSIQAAHISRNMIFRHHFYSTFFGKIASGVVGISMAVAGLGVWSLIGQSLSLLFFETLILWARVGWRPRRSFSWQRLKSLYNFAWKIMLMSFLEAISDQLRKILIGKKYTSEDLAYYDKGIFFPNIILTNIASSTSIVMFPVLVNTQENRVRVIELCRRWTGLFSYFAFPFLTGMIMTSRPVIIVLLTEKWLPAVLYMQLACLSYTAWIIEIPIRESIKSLGYANITLKMQLIKTLFSVTALIIIIKFGVIAIAISAVVSSIFNIVVSMIYGAKIVGYLPQMLLYDVAPTLLINIVMSVCIYAVTFLKLSIILTLFLQVLIGLAVYVGISIIIKNKNYMYVKKLITDFM